ncbi:MAG: hypothetical protein ACLFQB_11900 [Chitinispirillaceae bacterium]
MHRIFVTGIVCGSLLFSALQCTSKDKGSPENDCLSQQPAKLKGLQFTGGRTESNVVHELWKIQCKLGNFYKSYTQKHPELTGTRMKVSFTAEFNGDALDISVVETDISDTNFVKTAVNIIEDSPFSYWGHQREDTDITYTFLLPRE